VPSKSGIDVLSLYHHDSAGELEDLNPINSNATSNGSKTRP
jgi:hypothetical protein